MSSQLFVGQSFHFVSLPQVVLPHGFVLPSLCVVCPMKGGQQAHMVTSSSQFLGIQPILSYFIIIPRYTANFKLFRPYLVVQRQ